MSESGAGDARYSPRTLGSRPADSLVKTPVSNDPCQRPARAAVMTYHTSSLRPRTDNCNHVTRFFPIFFPAPRCSDPAAAGPATAALTNWRGEDRDAGWRDEGTGGTGRAARWRRTPSEDSAYRFFPSTGFSFILRPDLLSIQPPLLPP